METDLERNILETTRPSDQYRQYIVFSRNSFTFAVSFLLDLGTLSNIIITGVRNNKTKRVIVEIVFFYGKFKKNIFIFLNSKGAIVNI